jgi:hypothetical protein
MQYIRDLISDQSLTTQQIQVLFGAGTSLAFALDRTSDTARQQALEIAASRLGTDDEPVQYVLTPFGYEPLIIADYETLVDYLNSTKEHYNPKSTSHDNLSADQIAQDNVCGKACISQTVGAMSNPGNFFIVTDTPAGASDDAPDSIDSAIHKNIAVTVLDYYDHLSNHADHVVDNGVDFDNLEDGDD